MLLRGTAVQLVLVSSMLVASCGSDSSQECSNETYVLNYKEEVYNATQAFWNATSSRFIPHSGSVEILNQQDWPDPLPEDCYLKNGNQTLVCVFDYTRYIPILKDICENAGGMLYLDDYSHVCENEMDGRSLEKTYLNYTERCVGKICSASSLEERLEILTDGTEWEESFSCLVVHDVNSTTSEAFDEPESASYGFDPAPFVGSLPVHVSMVGLLLLATTT